MASKSINPRRKMTQAEFLERCRETHGDKYDYSLAVYTGADAKVKIICPDHGEFEQRAVSHYRSGAGCSVCSAAMRATKNTMTQEEFLRKAREKHGGRYDYSLVAYTKASIPVTIICPDHGEFKQAPVYHMQGHGCSKCRNAKTSNRLRLAQDEFMARVKKVHGDRYDYSRTVYAKSSSKVKIVCSDHGEFEQSPHAHMQGQGCPSCGYERSGDSASISQDEFLLRAYAAHGDKYDYSKVEYKGSRDKVTIICHEHGEFEQAAGDHLTKRGCKKCGISKRAKKHELTQDDFLMRARDAHGDRYDYSLVAFAGMRNKVAILCPDHGKFEQLSHDHARGIGCWKCGVEQRQETSAKGISAPEREMRIYIESLGFETEHGYLPDSDNKWTFDVIVPALKVAFEFNGVYWHSYPRARRGQHYYKRKHAEDSGYRMVTIWEDDWSAKRERMESLIRRVLLPVEVRVGARKTEVAKVARDVAAQFHTDYHIQDFKVAVASEHYALFDQDDMIAVASFDKKGVLHRYTIMEGVSILGGLGKAIKAFRGDFGQLPIVTYCDRDHFDGKLYAANGFELVSGTMQMSYVERGRRVRREKYMKHKLPDVLGADISSGTEMEICAEHGIYAAFNSGVDKYVLQAA